MFIEAPLSNLLIITMHLVTLSLGLCSGYGYTALIYKDQDLVNHCAIGNVLALATYVVLGAVVICILGKCGELWNTIHVQRNKTLFSMSDMFTSLCCFAMGAGYAGGIYTGNNTYNKCIIGNCLGWVSHMLLIVLITLRAYYVKRRGNTISSDLRTPYPRYESVLNTGTNNEVVFSLEN
jgi:hypothetical protein